MVRVKDTETGDVVERHPVDAREMVAQADGRYVYESDAPPAPELLMSEGQARSPKKSVILVLRAVGRSARDP